MTIAAMSHFVSRRRRVAAISRQLVRLYMMSPVTTTSSVLIATDNSRNRRNRAKGCWSIDSVSWIKPHSPLPVDRHCQADRRRLPRNRRISRGPRKPRRSVTARQPYRKGLVCGDEWSSSRALVVSSSVLAQPHDEPDYVHDSP